MTERQRRRRGHLEHRHGRPSPTATRDSVIELVRELAPNGEPLTVLSDEHRAYEVAFSRLPNVITHRRFTSRRCRSARNPLHVIDHLDLLLRHSSANHKRETIAQSKRRQGALERAAIFQVWVNFKKRRSENDGTSRTPAEALGLRKGLLSTDELLERRLFPSHAAMPPRVAEMYWRLVPTRQLPRLTRHALKYAA